MIPAKIGRLIPRLASPFDGEVIATRDAISRLLQATGLDWHDIAKACGSIGDVETSSTTRDHRTHGSGIAFGHLARAARDLDHGRLTPKERSFVADMCHRGFAFRPSPRQAVWLADIFSRLEERVAA